jgi:hypothetical protein
MFHRVRHDEACRNIGSMWARVAFLVLGLAVGLPGCEEPQSCTKAGCNDGVVITASSPGPLPDGEYRIALLLDGVAHSCTGPVPFLSAFTLSCESDAPGVILSFSEWQPSFVPPGTMPGGLRIGIENSAPRRIEMEISRDGNVIAAESFVPEYATLAPNGEACGPVCQIARIEAAPLVFE